MQDNIHINSNKNRIRTPSGSSVATPSVISQGELSPESTALSAFLATRPLIRTFIPLLIALGLLSLAFLILTMSRTHAETATASVTVPVSCTMTASPSSEHTTTMNNGTYNEVAAETTLGAACNDNGGYSIYAVGYSDNASGNTNSTSMIGPSISGTSLTIPTCTLANCTSTTPDVSRWAMKLTSISGASTPTILGDYNNYSPIPLETTKVITYPAITATDNRSETKATYAVAISSTQPSGTYTGKVKYTIVHPNYANADGTITKGVTFLTTNGSTITINGNTYANGASATLDAGTYTISGNYAEGFEFDSWSVEGGTLGSASSDPTTLAFTGPVTVTLNSKSSCSTVTFKTSNASSIVFNGTSYTNNQTTCVANGTYSIYGTYATKYAWQSWSATAGSFGNSAYQNTTYTVTGNATITLIGQSVTTAIQYLSSSNCTTTARPVYDTRDNSVYWVQQLADGKCWMLDNLAFDAAANVNSISTSNTNTSQAGINALKSGGSSPYSATAISSTWGDNTYTDARINVSGTFNSIAYTKDSTLVSMDAPTTPNHNNGAYGPGQGKVGVYYNYCAASGGTICPSSNPGEASYDICPAGWRMPTGNTGGEYDALYTNSAIGSDATKYLNALSTPLSGYFTNGSANNQGSNGGFWSSTRSDFNGMYRLYVNSSLVSPLFSGLRYSGYSVRCVLK